MKIGVYEVIRLDQKVTVKSYKNTRKIGTTVRPVEEQKLSLWRCYKLSHICNRETIDGTNCCMTGW